MKRSPPPLTERQRQCATLAAIGMTNAQIGRKLGLTHHTIRAHMAMAMAKTGAHNRAELAVIVAGKEKP